MTAAPFISRAIGQTGMQEIKNLTGLRAFAALSVVLLHIRYGDLADRFGPLAFIFKNQALGVDVFFVLSGFILAYVHHRDFGGGASLDKAAPFLWARLSRIYPVHLFMLVMVAVVVPYLGYGNAVASGHDDFAAFIANLLLQHAWGLVDNLTYNQASWTISAEWFAYLCFPIIATCTRRVPWWLFIVPALLVAYHEPNVQTNALAGGRWALKCLMLFTSGFCWFRFGERLGASPLWYVGAIVGGPFLVFAYWWPIQNFIFIFAMSLGFWMLCLFKSGPVFIYSNPVSVYLGKTSYSLYMSHLPTFLVFRQMVGGVQPLWIELPLVFAVASLIYHFVEEPARKIMRGGFSTSWLPSVWATPAR